MRLLAAAARPVTKNIGPAADKALKIGGISIRVLFKTILIIIQLCFLLGVAILLYIALYRFTVPRPYYERPLFFDYRTVDITGVIRPTAYAHFSSDAKGIDRKTGQPLVMKGERFLSSGQVIDASILLEIPTSPINRAVGMFSVELDMLSADDAVLASSYRLVTLKYESDIVRVLRTLVLAVPLLLGIAEEKDVIRLAILPYFVESSKQPLTQLRIKLSDARIQVYSATVHLTTRMRGISYYMYHYRMPSAVAGIAFIALIELFLWLIVSLVRFAAAQVSGQVEENAEAPVGHEATPPVVDWVSSLPPQTALQPLDLQGLATLAAELERTTRLAALQSPPFARTTPPTTPSGSAVIGGARVGIASEGSPSASAARGAGVGASKSREDSGSEAESSEAESEAEDVAVVPGAAGSSQPRAHPGPTGAHALRHRNPSVRHGT